MTSNCGKFSLPPPLPTSHSMGVWFNTNLNRVSATLALHTPLQLIKHRSKPSYSTTLSELGKPDNCTLTASKRDRHDASLLLSARAPRSSYFKAIKKAKRDHWCHFRSTVTPHTVLTGQKSAIGRHPPRFPELPGATTPLELNKTLLNHFFPGSPTNNHHTILLPCKAIPAL